MAKNGGRGRIRVFFAEVEGDDETIQEGLQAINVAANKIFQSTPTKIVKVLPASATPIDEDELLEELEDEDEALAPPNVAMNSKPKKSSYKPPIMSIVKDLNLRPEGELSFRDFYAQKKPNTQEQAVTVAVYYLRRVLELDKITPEHVFTCFKDVGRKTPKNMPQTVRDTAKNKGWVDTSERGNIKITNHGENMVDHDLPASNGKTDS
ncbi:hypothetical protein HNI00_22010 [Thermoleptolyngbya oregonensis NK1-22]|uniref:Uncharacterized protein n=1 Tax=Thermoleptolyngbya oregonensis NK1-22 TaxID=2547457 RepID=A0AA96Y857_9CYAN|nr:hypothetical protein [Thermoleptolyngbya oregonensis]WOB45509.1 hypothetical protein HNI00_22010 [Thermoleptolyngbya oregonensis NK1-22]